MSAMPTPTPQTPKGKRNSNPKNVTRSYVPCGPRVASARKFGSK